MNQELIIIRTTDSQNHHSTAPPIDLKAYDLFLLYFFERMHYQTRCIAALFTKWISFTECPASEKNATEQS